ncbi:c-type cytochrome [Psychrobium sp. nBUS_13]|uniref:c-type cytochrome n=1 Tax=Psychrobium sp. nBUS_13 TaxID=3395319 RepID=UPI003EBE1C07
MADCGSLPKGIECGIKVFKERCALCHGALGLGEGALPLSLSNYPNTNLLSEKTKGLARQEILRIITNGGILDEISSETPPWHDEFTCLEIDSVVAFVTALKAQPNAFLQRLQHDAAKLSPSLKRGRQVYKSRCVLCHGVNADGQGKMAKIIKLPPPFNLIPIALSK